MSCIVDETIATNGPEAVSGTRVDQSQPLVPQEKYHSQACQLLFSTLLTTAQEICLPAK